MQRLRDLQQLGTTSLVFPGATHSRFQHVVGTSYLGGEFVRGLYSNPRDPHVRGGVFECGDQMRRTVKLVEIAGLCHDLGHGPFSHSYDHVFLPKVARHGPAFHEHPNVQHEARSVMLFEHCCDFNNIDLDREEIRAVCAMIVGGKPGHSEKSSLVPSFAYDVVANSKHGIDVDKLDYIQRDVLHLNLPLGFDYKRLMRFSKVVGDNICLHRKEIYSAYQLFLTRYQLHRTVYNHRTALGLDAMIMDAFQEADSILQISDGIFSAEDFLRLSDSLLIRIEHSREASLASARALIGRIRRRQLYRFVDETLLPEGCARRVTEKDVVSYQETGSCNVDLRPEDVLIFTVRLNFGRGNTNPVDSVFFFKDWDDTEPINISSDKFSLVLPTVFEERIVRIYLTRHFPDREEERRAMNSVKAAFRRCVKAQGLSGHLPSPRKTRLDVLRQPTPATSGGFGESDDDSDVVLGASADAEHRMSKRQRQGR